MKLERGLISVRSNLFLLFLLFATQLLSQGGRGNAENYFEEALNHYRKSEPGLARQNINESLRVYPMAKAYYLSGLIYEVAGKPLRAVAEYEATIRLDPNYAEAIFQKALIYLQFKDPEQAYQDLTGLLGRDIKETRSVFFEIDPSGNQQNTIGTLSNFQSRIYSYRGQALEKMDRYAEAQKDYLQAVQLQPHADYFVNLGLLFVKKDQSDSAKIAFQKAIALQADHQVAWYNLTLIDPKIKLPDDLLEDEVFAPTLGLMAVRAMEKNDFELALYYYNQALESSEQPLNLINRGRVLIKLERFAEARKDLNRAKYQEPTRFETIYLIGNSYFLEENFEQALAYYHQYLAIDPSNGMIWYNSAMANLALEHEDEACHCLTQAAKLDMPQAPSMIEKHCP